MSNDGRGVGPSAIDDVQIADLLGDVVAGWTIPPIRLDAPSWRDRIRTPTARRIADAREWLSRVGQAGTTAIALSVVGALVAVLLTRSPSNPAASPGTSESPGSGTFGTAATALPMLLVRGDLPAPSDMVVQTEDGDFARVDLASGTIAGPLTGATQGSELLVQPDGTMLCLCLSESGNVNGSPTHTEVRLDHYARDGRLLETTPIGSFSGEPDPRDVGTFIPERPGHVFVAGAFSEDGKYGFVGWSTRAGSSWRSGILAVDLPGGALAGSLELPDASAGEGSSRRVVTAPNVTSMLGSDRVLVARPWYAWAPATSTNPDYTLDSEVFRLSFDAGRLSDATTLAGAAGCGDEVLKGGALDAGGVWLACSRGGSFLTKVRRLAQDGSVIGDVSVPGTSGVDGDLTALSPDGRQLFVWDPSAAVMNRVVLDTGERFHTEAVTSRAGPSVLSALGEWLAPAASAKSIMRGAVVAGPDGSRVYAIGVTDAGSTQALSGSSGVYVFDAATLDSLGQWPPTADFASLAISPDGQFLYAAGLPGVDAMGRENRDQPASVTVFATIDGEVRVVAGRLGLQMIDFPSATLN